MRFESARFYAGLRGYGKIVQAMLGRNSTSTTIQVHREKNPNTKYEKVGQKFDENIIPQPT